MEPKHPESCVDADPEHLDHRGANPVSVRLGTGVVDDIERHRR